MPISPIVLQRRHAELGRIRLGHKASTQRGGTRPAKLEEFRFTSPSERYIRDLAELYGGTAQPWDNGGMAQWEVFTEARTIPVIAVKGGLSQWMETWSGGGVAHRCDGERDVEGNPCNLDDPAHLQAKPTTRLSVMLPELEAIGVWRLETHGWNAAAEIPAVAELATYVGDLVPAHLHLVERRAIKDGKTSRFVVPVLDLQIGTARLKALVAEKSGTPALGAGDASGAVAIEAPRPDYAAIADTLLDVDSVKDLWRQAGEAGHLDAQVKAVLSARVEQIKADDVSDDPTDYDEDLEPEKARAAAAKRDAARQAPVDEPVDAEVVEDEPATQDGVDARTPVWQELLLLAGQRGMSNTDLQADVEFLRGKSLHDCTVEDLHAVLEAYRTGEVPEAATA